MGGGAWDASTYQATTARSVAAGTNFAYSSSIHSGAVAAAVHEDLDPKKVAGPASPLAGRQVRESRDSDEHPFSVPIAVLFDETGSMGYVPRELQTKLAELFGLLLRKGYVEDPQVLVGAYGDAWNREAAPLQVSQFESDNRIDDALDKIYLEGNGGGNGGESVALGWYYLANHTATDAWDKRGKKGYAFTVGDEVPHDVTRKEIEQYITVDHGLEADLSRKQVAELASERWELFHLVINNPSASMQNSVKIYTDLLGDHCIVLEDWAAVCETIAFTIGLLEGTVDSLDDAVGDVVDIGGNVATAQAASRALATLSNVRGGAVAVSDAPSDLDDSDSDSVRL
jgi:hypothetical protein